MGPRALGSVIVLCLVGLLWAAIAPASASSSGTKAPTGPTSEDLGIKGLSKLLNSKVVKYRVVKRPLNSGILGRLLGRLGFKHKGMEIVTADGKHWLVHKGNNYGRKKGGNTVVTSTRFMSSKWTGSSGYKTAAPNVKVSNLIKAGGKSYNLVMDNCYDAVNSMKNVMTRGTRFIVSNNLVRKLKATGSKVKSIFKGMKTKLQRLRANKAVYRVRFRSRRNNAIRLFRKKPGRVFHVPRRIIRKPVRIFRKPSRFFRKSIRFFRKSIRIFRKKPIRIFRKPIRIFRKPVKSFRRIARIFRRPVRIFRRRRVFRMPRITWRRPRVRLYRPRRVRFFRPRVRFYRPRRYVRFLRPRVRFFRPRVRFWRPMRFRFW